jgi:hypothetical protein
MATCPFIRPLQVTGGTFYSFTSATEDLALTFNNHDKKFRFSKYALLNIPNFATPAYNDNKVQMYAIDGALIQKDANILGTDPNVDLTTLFENYCLNLEATIISMDTYDRGIKHSVAERVFFKWLKEMGAIRFQPATSMETNTNVVTDPRFRENPEVLTGANRYYQVVQHIGSVDIVNNVQNNVNAYTEVYIHVPASDGRTPLVLFNSVSDSNYHPAMTIRHLPTDPLDVNTVYGRHYYDVHPAGLSTLAIFDQDAIGAPTSEFLPSHTPGNWYTPAVGPNAYFTDAAFGDATIDELHKTQGLDQVTYFRSRLDGISLEFDPNVYKPITDNPSITTIEQFNSTVDATNFEFNAVLLYYDVYDPNNLDSNGNPVDIATNLYGVLFLEDLRQIDTEVGIPRFAKYIPNVVTNINGNSYGIKVNLKFDTSADNVGTEKAVNDYSTFSLELFVDTFNILQQAAQTLNDKSAEIDTVLAQVAAVQDNIINQATYAEIDLRLTTVEDSLTASQALLDNSSAVMDLIAKNANDLAALVQGQTSVTVSYNIDAVKQGDGISIDRATPNQVKVVNANQAFNIQSAVPYQGDIILGATVALQKYTNYFRHYASGLTQTAGADITLQLDDTVNQWKFGQTMRLVFEDVVDLAGHSLVIVTDAPNRLGGGAYGVTVASIPSADFTAAGDRPIFDIVCVDPNRLTFVIDQIR